MLGRPRPDKAAALPPEAFDRFLGDQPLDQREGVGGVRQEALAALGIDLGGAAAETLADIDPAADRAAVAGAGADAEQALFEHDRVDAVPGQLKRRGEPGIAAANDRDPRRMRHLGKFAGNRPVRLPPIRLRRKIGMENAGGRHRALHAGATPCRPPIS